MLSRKAEQEFRKKLKVLAYVDKHRYVSKTCSYWGISRDTFYRWRRAFKAKGEAGLIQQQALSRKPSYPRRSCYRRENPVPEKNYHFGQMKISWYLARYHGIKVSASGMYSVLKRSGLNRLPQNLRKRQVKSIKMYEQRRPGHHVQIDVKFLNFKGDKGKKVRRYQYTAIDDATCICALKVYPKHNQKTFR